MHCAERKRCTTALVGAALVCAVFALASNLWAPVRALITQALEQRFARASDIQSDKVAGIIALGGSHDRIVEAVRLAHEYPKTKLVITGAPPEDEAYALAQGFSNDRLIIEPNATSTFENAVYSRRLLAPDRNKTWLIVTSAIHMPRAIGAFREAGFSVEPWPVFDQSGNGRSSSRPTMHEVFGLLGYWVLGRIDSLFPAAGS
jgi:uncharacterized SAM-binding protein YcdF (DUF218 family)